jgi:hypothetical protein
MMNERDRIPRIGVAVVLALVAEACGSPAGQGAASAPASSPAASVAASAAPSAAEPSPATYGWSWHDRRIVVDVPSGWVGDNLGLTKGEIGIGMSPPVSVVYSDACRSEGKLAPIGGSVDELVRALDDQISTDATVASTVLHGRVWTRVDLVEAPGIDRASCRFGAEGPLQIWADPHETDFYALAPGTAGIVLVTDVEHDPLVVTGVIGPTSTAADIANLESVIASIELR